MSHPPGARRLLVVNPNMTSGVTDAFVAEARAIAPPDVSIEGVTGHFGAAIVSIEAENIIASHVALELLARHWHSCDAAILEISFDSGLDGAREILPIPVIGITEAALLAAAKVSDAIGVVIFGQVSLPLYQRLVNRYGLEGKLAGWEVVEIASAAGYLDPEGQDRSVAQAIDRLRVGKGATAVVICGTAIVGMARRLQPLFPLPLFDGAAPAIGQALAAIATDPHPARLAKPLSHCVGLSPELTGLIAGTTPLPPRLTPQR